MNTNAPSPADTNTALANATTSAATSRHLAPNPANGPARQADRTALVLGATGGIGGAVARRLLAAGWHVKALHRAPADRAPLGQNFSWIAGDAMNRDDVLRAADGVSLLVHAVNPPGYRNWGQLVLPMIDNSIAAARRSGARIVLPGTVYNYGPDAFPDIAVDAAQHPRTRKGAIRVELERRLELAAADGVRSLIVRAGDFFGPGAANNWFSQGLVKPGQPLRSVSNPGRAGIGHQWAYLPDVAETICRLAEMEARLDDFARFHMDGHWDADGTQMAATVARVATAAGGGKVAVKPLPWWLLKLASPFVPTLREMMEMRYLWRQPVRLNNARLLAVLGAEPRTPLEQAVRATLRGLDCLPCDGATAMAQLQA
ncbi:NAD(P)H-binding protein [Rugamonas sp. CCM 8940]|uniref:NAD(P)H-binding protein n=1 Tax=Rugamonas sp. CCM 8940 TaxID=2765359 RepID=UPI0018F633D4|nr:NAD(P)H-binding protein [Rugamonas sp. CCM 8940]MBJ7308581.1 NAD(P)H-binding protein [Rugamonas sp. CCM 8940]